MEEIIKPSLRGPKVTVTPERITIKARDEAEMHSLRRLFDVLVKIPESLPSLRGKPWHGRLTLYAGKLSVMSYHIGWLEEPPIDVVE